jgi:quercetin dioxygenase-like cupin family protein
VEAGRLTFFFSCEKGRLIYNTAAMSRLIAAVLFLAGFAMAQQTQQPVEITSEPSHHLVLDNLFVRAFAVTVPPKASTLMHRHGHDYLSVALGESEIENVKQGAQPVRAKFKDGQVGFAAAGLVHLVRNAGEQPFRNITIELMQPTTHQKACTASCEIQVSCPQGTPCASVTEVMSSDQWSVTQVSIPAGGTYPQHTHLANFLVIPLTELDVTIRNQDQPETNAKSKPGEVIWNNPAMHSVHNNLTSPAKFVVLEFRGRPAGQGSEPMQPK